VPFKIKSPAVSAGLFFGAEQASLAARGRWPGSPLFAASPESGEAKLLQRADLVVGAALRRRTDLDVVMTSDCPAKVP
jgi:hypothetical protein